MKGFFIVKRIFKCAVMACGFYLMAAVACALAGAAYAQDRPAISGIDLNAGQRGVILTVTGSGPISVAAPVSEAASYSEIRVRISGTGSALKTNRFAPPDALPVREIELTESAAGVDMSVRMRRSVNGPVQIRGGGNQIRILLTKDAYPETVWSSSGGAAAPAQAALPPDAERRLVDIRAVERDNSAALYFEFNGPPAAAINRWDDSVVITFSHTSVSPELGAKTFTINGSQAYGSIRVAQRKDADRRNVVTAAVRLKTAGASPVAASEDTRYVLRLPGVSPGTVFLWSALTGVQSSQQLTDIKPEPLDMNKMTARAARDTQPFTGDAMFSVKDAPQRQAAAAAPGAVPQIQPARPETPPARPDDAPVFHDGETARPSPGGGLVRYKVFGRDPFVPLVRDTSLLSELPRVENLKLVGVLEDSRERIALLEDFKNGNRAFALRVNDPVEYGKVLRVHRDKVVFLIRDFDVSRSYTLSLSRDAKARGR